MLTVHLSCPSCSHTLRCHRLIAPGEQLRCPHCNSWFRAGIADPAAPAAEPRRGHGVLLAWLLFANLLLLAGGGIVFLAVIGNRTQTQERIAERGDSEPRSAERDAESRSLPVAAPIESLPVALSIPPAPPPKPAPAADPIPDPPAVAPPPPPLPEPPPRKAEQPAPEKAAPAQEEAHPAPRPRATPQLQWLPPHVQQQVDRAIDNGVEFLRRRQNADGSWGHQTGVAKKRFTPGISALCGLTLLECGVPATDGHVRSTAHYLRQRLPEVTTTYSLSMAILFFDRLGNQSDAALIRTLALRLVAGQKTSGGWDYYCPILSPDEELGLLARLYKDRPTSALDLFAAERKQEEGKLDGDLYRPRPSKIPPLELFITQDPTAPKRSPVGRDPKESADSAKPKTDPALPGDNRRLSKRALEAADKLPEALLQTPALHAAELLRNPPDLSQPRTDNSNTQFAILGLLIAENYDVPMERAMTLLDWRFRNAMTEQGGWSYRPKWQTTPAMTAAALMGLALKHGLLLPNRRGRGRNVVVYDDEILHRGFLTLSGLLDNYFAGFVFQQTPLDKLDLYCLWTIERVAVLYNLRELGSLQWYPAGMQLLLPLQREDGSWSPKGTTCLEEPSVASSFALLFLKRSNLTRGLSERLTAKPEDR